MCQMSDEHFLRFKVSTKNIVIQSNLNSFINVSNIIFTIIVLKRELLNNITRFK